MLIVKIADIPEHGLHLNIKDQRKTLLVNGVDVPISVPYSGFMDVEKTDDGRVLVEGSFSVTLRLTCSRCLESFDYHVMESFRDVFFPESFPMGHGVHELSREDLDVLYYRESELDLSLVYLEKTYLSLPMKPLCKEDCKGICPICGKNLNYGECDCNRRVVDPRWEKLAQLKEKLLKG